MENTKNKKQTETIKEPKEKKVRTVKVGTHQKTVIALWVVLIASVSFGMDADGIDDCCLHLVPRI